MMEMQMAIVMMVMVMMLTKSSTICIAYQRSVPQKASSCPLVVITYKLTAIFAITIINTITIATTATMTIIITIINQLRHESSTLILYKELSSPIFQSLSVSQ